MSNILIIHGFNSGPGNKSKILKKYFPQDNIYTPQLQNQPLNDLKLLQEFLDNNSDIHVIGTSLGGFYTIYLALKYKNRDDISFYVINPSYTPYNNFKNKITKSFINYKNNSEFIINKDFINELKILQKGVHSSLENLPNIYYYIGTEDEVLNHKPLIERLLYFKTPFNLYNSSQNHRYEDISEVIEQIKKNKIL